MRTAELFHHKTVFSFEVFPPRKTTPIESIYTALDELHDLNPDFISVTYSASGSANKEGTVAIASRIKNELGVESVAHLTCINQTKPEVLALLEQLRASNIKNILALLGDPVPGVPRQYDFEHASDLVTFIKAHGDFNVIAACYPEGHQNAPSLEADIRNLKTKVDCGADNLITQLFFDNCRFYEFMARVQAVGITVPIQAGIMPVISSKQAERIMAISGVQFPRKFLAMLDRYADRPAALLDAGIAFAVEQIVDLLGNGVDGIHLYTMNNPTVARRINDAVRSLIDAGSWCLVPERGR